MTNETVSVREIQLSDVELIASYWLNADDAYLQSMGVDRNKLPTREQFLTYLTDQIARPIEQKDSYCILWLLDNIPVGHSNTRPTVFGKEAFMHLHLWNRQTRSKGLGLQFVKLTLPRFFEDLQLKELYCEPSSLNAAPNKTIEKAGFELISEQVTTPGAFNFEQPVKRWCMTYEKFKKALLLINDHIL